VSAHATTVELAVQVPPLVDEIPARKARLAAIINDAWLRIDKNHRWYDAAIWAVVRIEADSEIAAGLRATTALDELAPRLAELDARHQPRPWQGSSTGFVCTAGCGAHPCIDSQILNGQVTS